MAETRFPPPTSYVRLETMVDACGVGRACAGRCALPCWCFWSALGARVRRRADRSVLFGQPTARDKLNRTVFQNGTLDRPLWKQIWVRSMKPLRFSDRAVMGILFGIALGLNRLLSDLFSIIHQFRGIPYRAWMWSHLPSHWAWVAPAEISLAVFYRCSFVVFANAFQAPCARPTRT